jgi:glyoxylate utilization-related uncharacterized protein
VALRQLENTRLFISTATKATKERYAGILQTEWGSAEKFVEDFMEIKKNGSASPEKEKTAANTFYILTKEIADK